MLDAPETNNSEATLTMKIVTSTDFIDIADSSTHKLAGDYIILEYRDGSTSLIPKNFFVSGANKSSPQNGVLHIGKGSSIGIGSMVKVNFGNEVLRIGRYVQGGWNLRFILNGAHNMKTITTHTLNFAGLPKNTGEIFGETVLGSDIWIGDEAMIMSEVTVGHGVIIGARSLVTQKRRLEPYGVYAGIPATLKKLRFNERIVELLLQICWWDKPLQFMRDHAEIFQIDLTKDINRSIDVLIFLRENAQRMDNEPTGEMDVVGLV